MDPAKPFRVPALKTLTWTSLRLRNSWTSFSASEQVSSPEGSPPGSGAVSVLNPMTAMPPRMISSASSVTAVVSLRTDIAAQSLAT